jgi:hypothetical protein
MDLKVTEEIVDRALLGVAGDTARFLPGERGGRNRRRVGGGCEKKGRF